MALTIYSPSLYRWERELDRRLDGEEHTTFFEAVYGLKKMIPVAGTNLLVGCERVFPRMAGGAGFTGIDDMVTRGYRQEWAIFTTNATGGVSGVYFSPWPNIGAPNGAGVTPAAIPGGSVPTNTTLGGVPFVQPGGTDRIYLTENSWSPGTSANFGGLLYDRTFHASGVNMTLATAQAVTGVPTRYQGAVGSRTSAVGSFCFLEITTANGVTAATVRIKYQDENSNVQEQSPVANVVVSSTANRIPHDPWFIPLNAPDRGLINVSEVLFSVGNTVGTANVVIGHPLAFLPGPGVAQVAQYVNGITSGFNLVEIQPGACLTFWFKTASATNNQFRLNLGMITG